MEKAKFVKRINRFTALVDLNGKHVTAHVANSGRLKELFQPGHEVYLVNKDEPHRVTKYDLSLVRYGSGLVSVDARVPNAVVAEAVDNGDLEEFAGFMVRKREVKYGSSRLDMLLEDRQQNMIYVEVKSVTLVRDGVARFPDAPTERGNRHLTELAGVVREGHRAAVVFLIQREDALSFTPNDETDPDFGSTLRKVKAAGVEPYAFRCQVTEQGIKIIGPVPVIL